MKRTIRRRLSPEQIEVLLDLRDGKLNANAENRYRMTPEEWSIVNNGNESESVTKDYTDEVDVDALKEYCKTHGINYNEVQSAKFINHSGQGAFNIVMKPLDIEEVTLDIKQVLLDVIKESDFPKLDEPKKIYEDDVADRLVYTDVHIAMSTDSEGTSMYATEWNESSIMETMRVMCERVIENKKGNVLYIDELGDFMDGWNAETTRGGHNLPQNMSNIEAFRIGLRFKLVMLDYLSYEYDKIICNNICNDNHSGDFGFVVNESFKQIAELKYNNVEVNNYGKFIDHYYIGRHAIILSHGKDKKSLKFGFKPQLDPKQIEKIDHYCKHNGKENVYRNSDFVEFSKGDSHQMLFDWSTAQDFRYMNYPALSPSSEWVQSNFKKGKRGFVIQHIRLNEDIINYLPIFL